MARFTLETENLIVRPFTLDDLEPVSRILNEGFGEASPEDRREWLEWTVRNYVALERLYQPPYGDYAIVLKATDEVIGSVGFVPCTGPFDTLPYFRARSSQPSSGLFTTDFGLFWVVDPAQRGNGYAAEAARAMIDYAFNGWNLQHIIATTEYDNLNSQKVMQKLGMSIEHNPYPEPHWFQVIGILENPQVSVNRSTQSLETFQENVPNV